MDIPTIDKMIAFTQPLHFAGTVKTLPTLFYNGTYQLGDIVLCEDDKKSYLFDGNHFELLESVTDDRHETEETEYRTNCCNCGAPLGFGSVCKYCGTDNILRKTVIRRF